MRTRHARQPLLDPHDGAASAIPNSTGLPSAKSPPAPAVKARDDDLNEGASSSAAAPAHTMDLDALPSVTLTPSMVAHLLQNIQEGSPAAARDTAPSSSTSSSSQPKRNTRRKAAVKPHELLNTDTSTSFSSAAVAGLHGQDHQPRPSHNISPSTIITTKQNTRDSEDNTADDTASLDTETKEGAAGVTRRTCSHCGRLFKRASDCRRHERIHTNDKPHPCPVPNCGKAFVQKSALTTHLRTHTGEKPYTCRKGNCSRIFADASSRKKHESTHDKDDKRYPCPVCPKQAFRRRDTLSLHMKRMHPQVAFVGFSDDPEGDFDMTSEPDAYTTSEMDMDFEENRLHPDEASLLHFSLQPTDHSLTSSTISELPQPSDLSAPHNTMLKEEEEDYTITYNDPLARSQSAPADDHPPLSPGLSRALSAPINETAIEPSGSLADIASLFFESSGSGSASSSSQSSFTTMASSSQATSRYPFTYNAPPLHRSTKGNNSDGENDRALARNTSRPSTSSAQDLFELLYTPSTPRPKSGNVISQHHHIYRTAPQARQPLTRVPSFGTPWAPGSPPKVQNQLFRELGDMFT